MGRVVVVRAMSLYTPAAVAFLLAYFRPKSERLFPAALVGFLWTLPSLLALQLFNLHFGWWTFQAQGGLFRGMPVDLYLGWAVLWGIVPVLAFRTTNIAWTSALFFAIDLVLMPACFPVVALGPHWLVGEAVALCVVLIPTQMFARWTLFDRNVRGRAILHAITATAIFLFLLPELIFALRPGSGWKALAGANAWARNLELQLVFVLGAVGVSAVQEFALRGDGTPIPYDPPKRLVASGLYRYVANPMQVSCAVVLAAWGGVLRNPWLALAGVMAFVYSFGLAKWDESEDMKSRFGEPWQEYRKNVRAWRFRWRPWHASNVPPARLYISETCGPCSEVRRWFESKGTTALHIVAAEDHPTRDLDRMTYDPMDGSAHEEGVRAFARGLEHIHLGWALAGAVLRLPGVSHGVQILLDGSGLGPRRISRRAVSGSAATCKR